MGGDVAVSVTGIAGPDGGTIEKPVGLVYVALSAADAERCERHIWQGGCEGRSDRRDLCVRLANKERSAEAALQLLLAYLQERGK
jgi:nicotinamide mononucleotide (NMN) deamidase PncC